ncbi:ActD protein [Corallococcus llansteffanensis]|uniref:ActD protein n=1 Tax=Corallococcus llansteffanensis TaxID=2316731 RepID=A0A3A8QGU9_9BACT|nr:ActD protein [Corallococcus llansteffanensis]
MPGWRLERFLLGELSSQDRAEVEALLARDPDARAWLDALRADTRRILETYPPTRVAAEVERRRRGQARKHQTAPPSHAWADGGRWFALGTPVAAMLAVLVWDASRGLPQDFVSAPPVASVLGETVRIKGDARLRIHRQGTGEAELLSDGAFARAGDVLQLSYLAADQAHGVVVSLDGRGVVTLHFPVHPGDSTALQPGGAVPLSQAYALDDAPGFERFILVTGDRPLDVAAILEAARRLALHGARDARLEVPDALRQASVTLRKTP